VLSASTTLLPALTTAAVASVEVAVEAVEASVVAAEAVVVASATVADAVVAVAVEETAEAVEVAVASAPTVVASASSRARRRASTKLLAPAPCCLHILSVSDLIISMVSYGSLNNALVAWSMALGFGCLLMMLRYYMDEISLFEAFMVSIGKSLNFLPPLAL